MPRYSRIPAILRTATTAQPKQIPQSYAPRLWNAKRRIKSSQGLTPAQYAAYKENPDSLEWREQVSPDVVEFIDAHTYDPSNVDTVPLAQSLLPEDKAAVLRSPSRFFSRPHRVPTSARQQIYFPDFTVTLMRKPTDSPYLASFQVPLWFNKLDMKSYLQELYGVSIVHVRSWVVEHGLARRTHANPRKEGPWYRPQSEKRMKVQLVEPFEWPAEPKDLEEYDTEEYWRANKAQTDEQRKGDNRQPMRPDHHHRQTIAQQARDLLAGRAAWAPSWKQIPSDVRVMEGVTDAPKPKNGDSRALQ